MKIDWEDFGYAAAAVVIAVLGKQIGKKQAEKKFHRDWEREFHRYGYELTAKKGDEE